MTFLQWQSGDYEIMKAPHIFCILHGSWRFLCQKCGVIENMLLCIELRDCIIMFFCSSLLYLGLGTVIQFVHCYLYSGWWIQCHQLMHWKKTITFNMTLFYCKYFVSFMKEDFFFFRFIVTLLIQFLSPQDPGQAQDRWQHLVHWERAQKSLLDLSNSVFSAKYTSVVQRTAVTLLSVVRKHFRCLCFVRSRLWLWEVDSIMLCRKLMEAMCFDHSYYAFKVRLHSDISEFFNAAKINELLHQTIWCLNEVRDDRLLLACCSHIAILWRSKVHVLSTFIFLFS